MFATGIGDDDDIGPYETEDQSVVGSLGVGGSLEMNTITAQVNATSGASAGLAPAVMAPALTPTQTPASAPAPIQSPPPEPFNLQVRYYQLNTYLTNVLLRSTNYISVLLK